MVKDARGPAPVDDTPAIPCISSGTASAVEDLKDSAQDVSSVVGTADFLANSAPRYAANSRRLLGANGVRLIRAAERTRPPRDERRKVERRASATGARARALASSSVVPDV